MIKKKLTKLVGIKKEDFDGYIENKQIQVQEARLIPLLKTGDEMALSSILLSSLRLVKEFRDSIFKELKLSRSGKVYYYTEAAFPEIDSYRIDGLILVVISGVIKEAAFLEMKNKNNNLDVGQVENYISLAKKLGVKTLATISNEFVPNPTHSPVSVRVPKNFSLFHFSWTYLITQARLLLFKNETNIDDVDQVEIMKEVLSYMESPASGVYGHSQMKPGWKELTEKIRAQVSLKQSDEFVSEAVQSWHAEEKDIALLMSRKLGVLVKSSSKGKDSIKNDAKQIVKTNTLSGSLSVKNAVSEIKVKIDFERRAVSLSNKLTPPLDKGNKAKITWIDRQVGNCLKRSPEVFQTIEEHLWVEADIKYAREGVKVKLSDLESLKELTDGREIQGFHLIVMDGFGSRFGSTRKFIDLTEDLVLRYYEGMVQHLSNWKRPAPKLNAE